MPVLVVAEHFELPDRVKSKIKNSMSAIKKLMPVDSTVRIFLKRGPRHGFEAVITLRLSQEDVTYTKSGDDLCELISSLKSHIKRQLVSTKEKRVHKRRKKPVLPIPAAS